MGLLALPPEIQTLVFFALPNMKTTFALRLSCKQLESIYQHSRTKIVTAQRERITLPFIALYELLERLWLPDGAVLHPPPGGWPNIAIEDAGTWRKSSFAMDILRHLPYIDYKGHFDRQSTGFCASVIDYTHRRPREWAIVTAERAWLLEMEYMSKPRNEKSITPTKNHIIQIAEETVSVRDALYLDTGSGLVYCYTENICFDGVAALEYCEGRIDAFTRLDEIFVPGLVPQMTLSTWGEEAAMNKTYDAEEMERQGEPQVDIEGLTAWTRDEALWVRHLHRKFGWPGQDWEKEACLEEIQNLMENRYP